MEAENSRASALSFANRQHARKLSNSGSENGSFISFLAVRAIGIHGVTFGGSRFVDDALEQPANRRIGQRTRIVVLRVGQHFEFAFRLIKRDIRRLLELADFERAASAFVEQLDELSVDFVDAAAPI